MMRRFAVLTFALLLCANARAQVTFTFDYTYDTSGLFSNSSAQSAMVAAGNYVANIISSTSLAAITPDETNTWDPVIVDPGTGLSVHLDGSTSVAANTITVYVGAYGLSALGQASRVSVSSYTGDWALDVFYRGNTSFHQLASIGSIAFNSATSWYFDTDPSTSESISSGSEDFFSVAVHELFHVLGLGLSSEWFSDTLNDPEAGKTYTGSASEAAYGTAVPLTTNGSHWAEGIESSVYATGTTQEVMMDPTLTSGTRKYATDLDVAALSDLGYSITAVPEPAATAGILGLIGLALVVRRRRARMVA